MIKVRTKIGNQEIVAEFAKMSDVHKFNKTYGRCPTKCDNCGSENIYPSYMNPGGNDYFTMECGDCTANANFGIHKDNKGLFWKGDKMKIFQREEEDPNKTDPASAQNLPEMDYNSGEFKSQPEPQDDLPF